MLVPTVMYGSETQIVRKKETRIQTKEMKFLL